MSKRSSNDILHRYFSAGDYSSGVVTETVTPSMDIQVSSNFERFLYHMSGDDAALMAKLMAGLESDGALKPTAEMLANSRGHMDSGRVSDAEILSTIKDVHSASQPGEPAVCPCLRTSPHLPPWTI